MLTRTHATSNASHQTPRPAKRKSRGDDATTSRLGQSLCASKGLDLRIVGIINEARIGAEPVWGSDGAEHPSRGYRRQAGSRYQNALFITAPSPP